MNVDPINVTRSPSSLGNPLFMSINNLLISSIFRSRSNSLLFKISIIVVFSSTFSFFVLDFFHVFSLSGSCSSRSPTLCSCVSCCFEFSNICSIPKIVLFFSNTIDPIDLFRSFLIAFLTFSLEILLIGYTLSTSSNLP